MLLVLRATFKVCQEDIEKSMEIILPSVAERLKPSRQKKNMKQKDMAELLGRTVQHYQRMEYGKVNLPATTVIFLADHLLGRE